MAKITKTPNQIREDYLRTIKAGLAQLGITANVSKNSDYYVQAQAVADQISALFYNIEVSADELMPDTATGEYLDRLLNTYGLSRKAASTASGKIQLVSDQPTFIVTGNELISSVGSIYQVIIGGSYSNGDIISVVSKDAGDQTNLAVGSILSWVQNPAGAQSTVVVTEAITGGVNAEDDETARTRLLSRLANPPGAGNWQQVAEIAEASDPAVQKAFVHAAANGPGTMHVVVVGYPSSVSKSRTIDSNKLNSTIIPYIKGLLPEYVETTITSATSTSTDVAFSLSLPVPTSSFGNSQNGGWLDATPFPTVDGTSILYCDVTAVTNTSQITIRSATAPSAGISRIAWVDRSNWTVKTARVTSYTGTGPYALTLDKPLVGIEVGDYVFPAATNAQAYLDAVVGTQDSPTGFYTLGPGEKTLLIPRSARQPKPSSSFPYKVDASILRALTNAGSEVQAAGYYFISDDEPHLPDAINDPTRILIPRKVGFYPPLPL